MVSSCNDNISPNPSPNLFNPSSPNPLHLSHYSFPPLSCTYKKKLRLRSFKFFSSFTPWPSSQYLYLLFLLLYSYVIPQPHPMNTQKTPNVSFLRAPTPLSSFPSFSFLHLWYSLAYFSWLNLHFCSFLPYNFHLQDFQRFLSCFKSFKKATSPFITDLLTPSNPLLNFSWFSLRKV